MTVNRPKGPRNTKGFDWYARAQAEAGERAEPPELAQLVPPRIAQAPERRRAWMEFSVGGAPVPGRVVVALLDVYVPETCARFVALRVSARGYAKTPVKRIVRDVAVMLGDVDVGALVDQGLYAIRDEAFVMHHGAAGVVSMASAGRDTGRSQFFITLSSQVQMDGVCVPFGCVEAGLDVVRKVGGVFTHMQRPLTPVVLEACGVMAPAEAAAFLAAAKAEADAKAAAAVAAAKREQEQRGKTGKQQGKVADAGARKGKQQQQQQA